VLPGSQAAGDSKVTFPVTVLSPAILYNKSQVGEQEKDTMTLTGCNAAAARPGLEGCGWHCG
jgi:hypothetical protein